MNDGILPLKSSNVCNLTADFADRKSAHGKTEKQRSIVDESSA
jgi:hypothetical protein